MFIQGVANKAHIVGLLRLSTKKIAYTYSTTRYEQVTQIISIEYANCVSENTKVFLVQIGNTLRTK